MIEVEKNFDIRPYDKERIIKDAALVAKKTFTDIYWDSSDFILTGKDHWLRQRNGRWELKVPLNREAIANRTTDQYEELEQEEDIVRVLNVSRNDDLAAALRAAGYAPFATIITTRESYQKGEFHLDFDEMDFGFTTFEVELMVEDATAIENANEKIILFAREYDIGHASGAGKVIEYIRRNNPKHFLYLVERGIVEE